MTTCPKCSGPNFKIWRKYLENCVFWKSWKCILGQSKKALMTRSHLRNIISKTVQITTNVNIINRETVAYLFYEKQKMSIMRTWMKKILLIISNFGELKFRKKLQKFLIYFFLIPLTTWKFLVSMGRFPKLIIFLILFRVILKYANCNCNKRFE